MVQKARNRSKKNKHRGNRLHGKGDTKHKRGHGSHGGQGRGGAFGHKRNSYYKEQEKGHRYILKPKTSVTAVNLDDIMQQLPAWAKNGKVKKEGALVVLDGDTLGIDKLLSRGSVTEKLMIKNMTVSEKAKEKILSANGQIEGSEDAPVDDETKEEAE